RTPPADLASLIGQTVADKVNQAVADKLTEQAVRHEQMAAKAAKRAAALDHLASHLGALDVWMRAEPRGRRPRFTRDDIAAAAVRIADAEGFGALSMRRLAAELGAGTMTLYHYVRTKDELLTLVTDTVMGEVVVAPEEPLPDDWRAAVTVLANRSRTALLRHPWILDIADDPPIGPNSVRHFDQTLEALSSLDVDLATKFDIVSAVDEYVFGFCMMERNNLQRGPGVDDHMVDYVSGLLSTGTYPQLTKMADELGLAEGWARIEAHFRDPERFDRNLARLLSGLEQAIAPPERA
ncbi:MAG TPA: TetR/AcrR family transcriptional regulator, partial [Acidimicrobiales bacterium]|nr:TetR/AcrR family transcriptional regulator [Acidimicrobiales bacterium]